MSYANNKKIWNGGILMLKELIGYNIHGYSIHNDNIKFYLSDESNNKRILLSLYISKYDGPPVINRKYKGNPLLSDWVIHPVYQYTYETKEYDFKDSDIYFKPKQPLKVLLRGYSDAIPEFIQKESNIQQLIDLDLVNGPKVKYRDGYELISENVPRDEQWDVYKYSYINEFIFLKGDCDHKELDKDYAKGFEYIKREDD